MGVAASVATVVVTKGARRRAKRRAKRRRLREQAMAYWRTSDVPWEIVTYVQQALLHFFPTIT